MEISIKLAGWVLDDPVFHWKEQKQKKHGLKMLQFAWNAF